MIWCYGNSKGAIFLKTNKQKNSQGLFCVSLFWKVPIYLFSEKDKKKFLQTAVSALAGCVAIFGILLLCTDKAVLSVCM